MKTKPKGWAVFRLFPFKVLHFLFFSLQLFPFINFICLKMDERGLYTKRN